MGPPVGSCPPDSSTSERVCADTDSKDVWTSGGDRQATVSHSGSKRSAQHAEYHNVETKRRQESAERAAQAQKHATQLVQQLAAPDGHSLPQESSGILAKAEDRQNAYNMSIDSKPWASGHDSVRHNMDPTSGLPMQTGHYSDASTYGGATDDSPVEQTNSDPAMRAAAVQSDSSEGDNKAGDKDSNAGSPSASECAKFSSTQKFKRNVQSNSGLAAIKSRQIDEQTHQNHPQNISDSGKSLPPVVQQLQRAQQRAHDELEAAEKESSNYRFPAEAGQRFVTNARKNKAKLDVLVYENGRGASSRTSKQ